MNILEYLKMIHIDPVIVLIVIASGFFQNRFLCYWEISKDQKTAAAFRTLIVSAAASLIYLWLVGVKRDAFAYYFLSFFLATSLYELLIRPLVKWIKKETNQP